MKTKETIQESMKQKLVLWKSQQDWLVLANLSKIRREKTQISKIRNEKWEITSNTKEIQGIIRDYFKNLYWNKLENLDEMNRFLDSYDHLNLNINHLNTSIHTMKLKQNKELPKKQKSRTWKILCYILSDL
jgi:dGTP triphosphohydrolase